MAAMKPFMMAAAALALLAMELMCVAPPTLAEGRELQHAEAEKAETSGEALKTEPEDQKTELARADQETWGGSPPWHKVPRHNGHHGHRDGKKRSHHESKESSHHAKAPRYDHDKKKPYPYPPY